MIRTPVVSHNVAEVGYSHGTLEVAFKYKNWASVYQYFNVPEDLYNGLMEVEHPSTYINTHIKGAYEYKKVE